MRCPSCGQEIPAGARVCPNCHPRAATGPGPFVFGLLGLVCGGFLGAVFGRLVGAFVGAALGLAVFALVASVTRSLRAR